MGMGSLRGERSGVTDAIEGNRRGWEGVCQVLCIAKLIQTRHGIHHRVRRARSRKNWKLGRRLLAGVDAGGESSALQAAGERPGVHRSLKPQGSADSALRYR